MKNRYLILIFAAMTALFATSCNKFLDELPDNRTDADTADQIQRLLASAYPDHTYAVYTALMSDDHDDIGTRYGTMSDYQTYMTQAWNWEPISEEDMDTPWATWEAYYLAIAHSNQALKSLEALGNPAELDYLRGEALVARAWNHFKLVNIFCQNYSASYSGTDLGIPYVDASETDVVQTYERGTVRDVYAKIERDLLAGLPLIDDTKYSVPKYHFNRQAANAFAAEFYLFYKKYNKVIEYAGNVLGDNPDLMMRDVTVWADDTTLPMDAKSRGREYIRTDINANLLLQPVESNVGLVTSNYYYSKRYLHNEYIHTNETLASPGILWRTSGTTNQTFYMQSATWSSTPSMCNRINIPYLFEYTDPVAQIGVRHSVLVAYSAETALLARAEAYIMEQEYDAAMDDINLWVAKRVNPRYGSNTPKTAAEVAVWYNNLPYYEFDAPTPKKRMNPEVAFADANQENMMHAMLHVRRIEFFGEGARWFDVKRYNIEIVRRQYRLGNVVTLEDQLKSRDKRMAIQLPASVIAAGMEPNPR